MVLPNVISKSTGVTLHPLVVQGLSCGLSKGMSTSQPLQAVHVTLFGKSIFVDTVKLQIF